MFYPDYMTPGCIRAIEDKMDKALVWCLNNGLSRYDGKEYIETVFKLHRDSGVSGPGHSMMGDEVKCESGEHHRGA